MTKTKIPSEDNKENKYDKRKKELLRYQMQFWISFIFVNLIAMWLFDKVIAELQEIIQFIKTPERFTHLGGRIPNGVLLVHCDRQKNAFQSAACLPSKTI